MSEANKPGHVFLASLGKKRLRPGGIKATNWLVKQAQLNENTHILEIACNMATTSIELAQKYGCKITAIDIDKDVVAKAKANVLKHNLADKITVIEANATSLPFEDETFDVVINEAMLTMYEDKAKAKFIKEYKRVLKTGGMLLTHDIRLVNKSEDMPNKQESKQVIKVNVSPITKEGWIELFTSCGFSKVECDMGDISLLTPTGLLRDEGLIGTLRILKNGLKNKANRTRLLAMRAYFTKHKANMGYIAVCSKK